uniref:Uncharacterized protein n=1 Tax=Tetraselmis sp. GSL018 TaxID=582737 RepID=A0A061RK15_9CHLO
MAEESHGRLNSIDNCLAYGTKGTWVVGCMFFLFSRREGGGNLVADMSWKRFLSEEVLERGPAKL